MHKEKERQVPAPFHRDRVLDQTSRLEADFLANFFQSAFGLLRRSFDSFAALSGGTRDRLGCGAAALRNSAVNFAANGLCRPANNST